MLWMPVTGLWLQAISFKEQFSCFSWMNHSGRVRIVLWFHRSCHISRIFFVVSRAFDCDLQSGVSGT